VTKIRIRLIEWEEVIGVPEKVEGNLIIFTSLGEVGIDDGNILQKAKENIGKKIAILRTDIEGKEYCWRVVE